MPANLPLREQFNNKRVLFVFSDPGGAKPVLALTQQLKEIVSASKIVSDRQYSFFGDFEATVEGFEKGSESRIITDFNPDIIFTGTSYTSDIERSFISEGNKRGIKTISFIDHWTNFKERFTNSTNETTYPAEVWVINEKAKQLAIQAGLPDTIIKISSNPYYQYLKNWKPELNREELFSSLNIPLQNKIVLYAPDPLTNNGGKGFYGTDETEGLAMLVTALENIKEAKNYSLIVKAHPNQNISLFDNWLNSIESPVKSSIKILKEGDVNPLIYYSDTIIGFFSNFLIESIILGKKVIRLTKNLQNDSFPLEEGVELANTDEELRISLKKII